MHLHVNVDLLPLLVQCWLDIKGPQHPRDVDGDRRSAKVHPGANTAAPAKGTVAQGAGVVVPLLEEALWPELVGFGEICLVEMD